MLHHNMTFEESNPNCHSIWFGSNEWMLRLLREHRPMGIGMLDEFLCGATAGTMAWAVNFPSDKAKTIVQAAAARRPGAPIAAYCGMLQHTVACQV